MSSTRIKKIHYFNTPTAIIFYCCDLPMGYRIARNSKQKLGQIYCITQQKVYKCQLSSIPHLNPTQEWNQNYFTRVIYGMSQFIVINDDEDQDRDNQLIQMEKNNQNNQNNNILTQQQSQNIIINNNNINSSSSKLGLVRDLTQTSQQVLLLRCKLYQDQFHIIPMSKLWQLFQKYNKSKKKQQFYIIKQINQLQQQKITKIQKVNQLYDKVQYEKNQIKWKLTILYKEKVKKLKQFDDNADETIQKIGRYNDESSSMINGNSNINQKDIEDVSMGQYQFPNSQDSRQLVGSLFDPTQSYENNISKYSKSAQEEIKRQFIQQQQLQYIQEEF